MAGLGGRRALAPALAFAAVLALTSCGSASAPSPPTGVDGLVIPTPDVDPHDFVAGVDNRWLPLRPGATWTYQTLGRSVPGGGAGTTTVAVLPGTTRIDGVATTAVRTVVQGATAADTTVDYYAQDTAGNVWWLGNDGGQEHGTGDWRAGTDGAEAGLAMPAHPRYGDGWREAYLPGVVEDRATVVEVDDEVSASGHRYRGVLDLDVSSDLAPGITQEQSYAAGVGLVRSYAADGPANLLDLTGGP